MFVSLIQLLFLNARNNIKESNNLIRLKKFNSSVYSICFVCIVMHMYTVSSICYDISSYLIGTPIIIRWSWYLYHAYIPYIYLHILYIYRVLLMLGNTIMVFSVNRRELSIQLWGALVLSINVKVCECQACLRVCFWVQYPTAVWWTTIPNDTNNLIQPFQIAPPEKSSLNSWPTLCRQANKHISTMQNHSFNMHHTGLNIHWIH